MVEDWLLTLSMVFSLFQLSQLSTCVVIRAEMPPPENSPSLMVYSPLHCSAPVGGQNPCIALINWEKRELDISRSGLTQAILLHVHVDIYWTYNSARKKNYQVPYEVYTTSILPLKPNLSTPPDKQKRKVQLRGFHNINQTGQAFLSITPPTNIAQKSIVLLYLYALSGLCLYLLSLLQTRG